MSDKMKKVEKESNLWKTRFENCNKALTDMIEEVNVYDALAGEFTHDWRESFLSPCGASALSIKT